MVQLTQRPECKDKVHAANVTRIMLDILPIIERVQFALEVRPEENRTVDIEMVEVDVDDLVHQCAILGHP